EVADRADAGADARLALDGRQLAGRDGLFDLGEAAGRERVAGEVRHDFREIADAPLGVQDSGFLAAGRAEAQQLHDDLLKGFSVWLAQRAGGSCVRRRSCTSAVQNAPGNWPPSISTFWPVIKPAWAEHRNAQATPNSSGVPKRLAGTDAARAAVAWSTEMPCFLALASMLERSRSVSNAPGRRKLMVTLESATDRATPAMKAVSPA